jgi:glycosyltransferase involved in cell wall biosynthesis
MISILIPTYNYDITKLVKHLHKLALESMQAFEIIVAEDGSTNTVETNSEIQNLSNCKHIILEKNMGRAAIRNFLALQAQYEHLLFMDADALVCSESYIAKYLAFCNEECIVIGGTAYDGAINDPNYSLRLTYGRQREARNAAQRSILEHELQIEKKQNYNFSAFNFLISKQIILSIPFDEKIRGYGHEDMLLGYELHQKGYRLSHIDNPLIHNGLDTNKIFLSKTEEACKNLLKLHKSGAYPFLETESKLLKHFLKMKKLKISWLASVLFSVCAPIMRTNLYSRKPSLAIFDAYKLLFICYCDTNN